MRVLGMVYSDTQQGAGGGAAGRGELHIVGGCWSRGSRAWGYILLNRRGKGGTKVT